MNEHSSTAELKNTGLAITARPGVFKNWLKLILWVVLVLSFMFVWGPWLIVRIPGYPPIIKAINDYDINATGYYYSDVKETLDSQGVVENTLDYSLRDHTK